MLWRYVVSYLVTKVSRENIASMFRIAEGTGDVFFRNERQGWRDIQDRNERMCSMYTLQYAVSF